MTHTTKHTPGPWVVSDDGDVTLIVHAPKDEVDIACMSNDCEMFSEIRANANLIAAAPAMYEALVKTMKVLRSLRNSKEEWYTLVTPELLTAWDMNKAALSQAEGRDK